MPDGRIHITGENASEMQKESNVMEAARAGKPGGSAEGKAGGMIGGGGGGKGGGDSAISNALGPQRQQGGMIRPPAAGINRVDSGMQITPPNPAIGGVNIGQARPSGYGATPPGMVRPAITNQGMDIPFDPRTLR